MFQSQVRIELKSQPMQLSFHPKSDYLVSTQPESAKRSECILVHCFSKAQSQVAFHKLKASTEVQ
jgi:ribosome biogenesis protein ERB1